MPTGAKLEMTVAEVEMMVYMLGAIDLRTEPETLRVAMGLREKLSNVQKFLKKKPERPKDKYGKPMTDKEIEEAQEVASKLAPAQAEAMKDIKKVNPSANAIA